MILSEFNFGVYQFNIAVRYMKHKPNVITFLRIITSTISTRNEVIYKKERLTTS